MQVCVCVYVGAANVDLSYVRVRAHTHTHTHAHTPAGPPPGAGGKSALELCVYHFAGCACLNYSRCHLVYSFVYVKCGGKLSGVSLGGVLGNRQFTRFIRAELMWRSVPSFSDAMFRRVQSSTLGLFQACRLNSPRGSHWTRGCADTLSDTKS